MDNAIIRCFRDDFISHFYIPLFISFVGATQKELKYMWTKGHRIQIHKYSFNTIILRNATEMSKHI